MVASGALAHAKGVLLVLLRRARRDHVRVALICFGGERADIRFGPALPSGWNERWIEPIGGGGGTPLQLGLMAVERMAATRTAAAGRSGAAGWRRGDMSSGQRIDLCLLSDGRTPERPLRPAGIAECLVIDFETNRIALNGCAALANAWGASHVHAHDVIGT